MRRRSWTDEELAEAVASSSSMRDAIHKLGLRPNGLMSRRIREHAINLGFDLSHFMVKPSVFRPTTPDADIFKLNSTVDGGVLRRAFKRIVPYKCRDCPCIGEWNGKPITLQVEHVNGNHRDNRYANLCWLCPNCHSQTSTWGGRSTGRWKDGKKVDRRCGLKPDKPGAWRVDHREVYEEFCKTENYLGTGKLFGISDNAVRKIVKRQRRKNEAIV